MNIKTIAARLLGWAMLLHVLPLITMLVAFTKSEPLLIGYLAGWLLNVAIVVVLFFLGIAAYLIERN